MNKQPFQESQTIINLACAFIRESQAGARYQFMSEKTDEEKYCYLAELVKKQGERCVAQAKVFYDLIEQDMTDKEIEIEFEDSYLFKKEELADNFLSSAEDAETLRDEIYPEFARVAKEEGFIEIAKKFEHMYQIKDCTYMLMQQIGQEMKANKLYKKGEETKFKCDNCGHEETLKEGWDKCPFCGFEQGHIVAPAKSE